MVGRQSDHESAIHKITGGKSGAVVTRYLHHPCGTTRERRNCLPYGYRGTPTSEEKTRTHRPSVEKIMSGLQGTIDGLNDANTRPEAITGVAICPVWETDATG